MNPGHELTYNECEDKNLEMDLNPLVRFLQKIPEEFDKDDIIRYIYENGIEVLNLCYAGADSRMKTLNFPVKNYDYLNLILEAGERVDGSSLFPFIDPGNSDIYVIPRYKTAFVNPFSPVPALNIMCAYFHRTGTRMEIGPHNVVHKIDQKIRTDTGIVLKALGELEYYAYFNVEEKLYPSTPQKNYHESSPFVKGEAMREEILAILSHCGVNVKYAHSEVGKVPAEGNRIVEQHEIELLSEPIVDMADHLLISKWVIRNVADKYGVKATFAPKVEIGHAGSGLHIHLCGDRDGESVMGGKEGKLSETAHAMIGGLLKHACSLTAFGNMVPTSFLRLVPHQEAPTRICWGERNRSALIRVPLGWANSVHMGQVLNYGEEKEEYKLPNRQTFEIRSPDSSAHPYYLLAALGTAIHWGLTHTEEALKLADYLHVQGNIFADKTKGERFEDLPSSCYEAAVALDKDRELYEEAGFPKSLIDGVITQLRGHNDKYLIKDMEKDLTEQKEVIEKFLHCG